MDPFGITVVLLSVAGSLLAPVAKAITKRDGLEHVVHHRAEIESETPVPEESPTGIRVLSVFAVVVVVFGIVTAWRYWERIKQNDELLIYGGWLFIAMVFGMFVQVIAFNYRAGKPLFHVSAAQLIFPILFSLIVFYAVWVTASTAPPGLFSFYAAFLNGYFWESVVNTTRLPNTDPKNQGG